VSSVDELTGSSGLARDPARLRARLAADGYLFFRGLPPAPSRSFAVHPGWVAGSFRPAELGIPAGVG